MWNNQGGWVHVIGGGGGGGTVTFFSAGNLNPLFTTNVANPATTPALSFTAISQNAHLAYASPAGAPGIPSFRQLSGLDYQIVVNVSTVTAGANGRISYNDAGIYQEHNGLYFDDAIAGGIVAQTIGTAGGGAIAPPNFGLTLIQDGAVLHGRSFAGISFNQTGFSNGVRANAFNSAAPISWNINNATGLNTVGFIQAGTAVGGVLQIVGYNTNGGNGAAGLQLWGFTTTTTSAGAVSIKGAKTTGANIADIPDNEHWLTFKRAISGNDVVTSMNGAGQWYMGGVLGTIATANIQLFGSPAGAAGTAPMKIEQGTLLIAEEPGVIESGDDGGGIVHVYWTDDLGNRWQLDRQGGGGGGLTTGRNGLNNFSATIVELGGTLLHNTTITTDDGLGGLFKMIFTGTIDAPEAILNVNNTGNGVGIISITGSGKSIEGISSSNTAIYGFSTSGNGVEGYAQTGIAGVFQNYDTHNGAVTVIAQFQRIVGGGGTPVAGMGGSTDFVLETDALGVLTSHSIVSKWTDAANATATARYEIWGINNGAIERKLAIEGNGQLTLDDYGLGTFTATPAFGLAVNGAGVVIETTPSTSSAISLTYADATALIGSIVEGQTYIITDATANAIPLMVTGTSVNTYSVDADDASFPDDVVEYSFGDDVITYRWDTEQDISQYADWRNGDGVTLGGSNTNIHLGQGCIGSIGTSSGHIDCKDSCTITIGNSSAYISIGYAANVTLTGIHSNKVEISDGCDVNVNSLLNCIINYPNITIGTGTESFSDCCINANGSNFPATIDVTGLTTIDITGFEYCGIINLTSGNPTENIDTVTNFPTSFPFSLYPEAGLDLTVTGTAFASIAAGGILMPTASVALSGDKSEWLSLQAAIRNSSYLIQVSGQNNII